jgi:hypothetical protein
MAIAETGTVHIAGASFTCTHSPNVTDDGDTCTSEVGGLYEGRVVRIKYSSKTCKHGHKIRDLVFSAILNWLADQAEEGPWMCFD